jgi:hypothetical protein
VSLAALQERQREESEGTKEEEEREFGWDDG